MFGPIFPSLPWSFIIPCKLTFPLIWVIRKILKIDQSVSTWVCLNLANIGKVWRKRRKKQSFLTLGASHLWSAPPPTTARWLTWLTLINFEDIYLNKTWRPFGRFSFSSLISYKKTVTRNLGLGINLAKKNMAPPKISENNVTAPKYVTLIFTFSLDLDLLKSRLRENTK